jgi:glycosyltransferase involved in cell wall biosynthesis
MHASWPMPETPSARLAEPTPVVLVMGDFGDERCGVGSSEAVLAPQVPGGVRVLDPGAGSLWAFRKALAVAASGARGAVVVYPTVSHVERVRLIPRLLLVRRRMRRRWVRVHLHEFDRLRRRHRPVIALMAGLIADRTVVSSEREANGLRRRYRGWGGRREVAVVPPANGSAPSPEEARAVIDERRPGTVGLFGQCRLDKGQEWLLDVLAALDARFDRLEIVGRGWEVERWPAAVRDRYAITNHGQTDQTQLAKIIGRWDLALAPYHEPPHDGRLSLRTPLAHGVPTLTVGPRPEGLRLEAPHLLFDDEVELGSIRLPDRTGRLAGLDTIARLEADWRAHLVAELFGP